MFYVLVLCSASDIRTFMSRARREAKYHSQVIVTTILKLTLTNLFRNSKKNFLIPRFAIAQYRTVIYTSFALEI